ncbi:nucleosome assembly protein 1;2-like [Rosa chinensis]|uniref:nucleosome assembly protein 1;2-like n=1 Tax=Rosa chinensis TaxID=74649 RepID=UPI001AD90250|nr:nucleosome assembly protein 1;2-like [Rosa chinensis]
MVVVRFGTLYLTQCWSELVQKGDGTTKSVRRKAPARRKKFPSIRVKRQKQKKVEQEREEEADEEEEEEDEKEQDKGEEDNEVEEEEEEENNGARNKEYYIETSDTDEGFDEETAKELQGQIEQDYDIGSMIRDKIIPHAVSWFTRVALQDEFEDIEDDDGDVDENEDDDEDEDEEDDEDDDEDGEEDEEEEEEKGRKKPSTGAKKRGKAQGVEGGERPSECKRQ